MSPVKSVLAGLAVGIFAYVLASNAGGLFRGGDRSANIGDTMVTDVVAPSAKVVSPTLSPSVTKLSPSAKVVSPTLSPSVTVVAPVIPRITASVSATPSSPTPSVIPSSVVVPRVTTPTPVPTPTPTPTPSSSPSPIASPSLSPTPSDVLAPTPTPVASPIGTLRVVINEVAWAGTAAHASDEWIELYNAGTADVDLNGWSLQTDSGGGATNLINLQGILMSGEYLLIERTDDTTISDIVAGVKGSFGGSGLSNSFERLWLQNAESSIVDEIARCIADDEKLKWCGGSASPQYASLERIDPLLSGVVSSNWASNTGLITTGLDAAGGQVRGTPKYKNSVSL